MAKVYLEIGGKRIRVPDGEITLGRSRRAGIVLPDKSISRIHALMSAGTGRVTLQDLESSNGTLVNGERLVGETDLEDGDQVTLGETELTLVVSTRVEPPAAADDVAATVYIPTADLPSADHPRPLSRSEALSVGDVLPVGEVLARESGSWDATGPMISPAKAVSRDLEAVPPALPALEPEPEPPALGLEPEPPPLPEVTSEPGLDPPTEGSAPPATPEVASAAAPAGFADPEPALPAIEDAAEAAGSPAGAETSAAAAAADEPAAMPTEGKERAALLNADPEASLLSSIENLDEQLGLHPLPEPEPAGRAGRLDGNRPPSGQYAVGTLLPAGLLPRGAAALVDASLVFLVASAAALAAGGFAEPLGQRVGIAVMTLVGVLMPVVGWSVWATTPGKRLFGLFVCGPDGDPGIPVWRGVVRWLGYALSAALLGIGFLLALFTTDRRALHDLIAGTLVGQKR